MTLPQETAPPPIVVISPRSRARLISIAIHAAVIALIIFGLPYLPKREPLEVSQPIAVSMVMSPAQEEPAAASSAPAAQSAAPAAQAEAPAPEAEAVPSLPYDPSFNPFASSPKIEMHESPAAPQPAPPTPMPTQGMGDMQGESSDSQSDAGGGPPGAVGQRGGMQGDNSQMGNTDGDPRLHPQYLRVQLNGYINAIYAGELHMFLQRLIECGVVPIPARNPDLTVEADVIFNPLGQVQAVHLTNQSQFAEPAYNKASGSLMAALTTPNCAYIRLPVQNFPVWHQVHISFFQHIPAQ